MSSPPPSSASGPMPSERELPPGGQPCIILTGHSWATPTPPTSLQAQPTERSQPAAPDKEESHHAPSSLHSSDIDYSLLAREVRVCETMDEYLQVLRHAVDDVIALGDPIVIERYGRKLGAFVAMLSRAEADCYS